MSLRKIFYAFPPRLRLLARRIYYFPVDLFVSKKYENGISVPPKSLIFTGGGDFISTGFRFIEFFKKYGGITPESHVLDIGSGIGRIAIPLSHFLNSKGSYNGIDIMSVGIKWCNQNITTAYPNFNFHLIDLKNDLYRNSGKNASEFTLDFPDNKFDFISLISVFTHMLPEEISQYLSEISRCLKIGSSCLITFFIYEHNDELTNNRFNKFIPQDKIHALMNEKVKSANVAYSKEYLEKLISKNNFKITHFSRGGWVAGNSAEDFQDIIVITKTI